MTAFLRLVVATLVPGALLIVAAAAFLAEPAMRSTIAPFAPITATGAVVTSFLLAWFHDRVGVLASVIAVGLAVAAALTWPDVTHPGHLAAIVALALLMPVFAWVGDRAVLSWWGVAAITLLSVAVAIVARVAEHPALRPDTFDEVVWACVVGLVAVVARAWLSRAKGDVHLAWVFAATALGLFQSEAVGVTTFATAAGLTLVLSVLEYGVAIANRDELTNLPSRRAAQAMLERLRGTYAIAFCDIDHFKGFNDRHGHEAGDQVLRMVAGHLKDIGGSGRAFRYGGEEFLVVFTGRTAREAAGHADVVRARVAATPLRVSGPDGMPVNVTVSIGVAERSARHRSVTAVIEAADGSLYRAKAAGRDRVMLAEDVPHVAAALGSAVA